MWNVIGTIIFGAVIGVLARLVLPGKQPMGWLITIVLGVAGALIGYWVWGSVLNKGETGGIDWIRWIISIAAAVLCLAYGAIVSRKTTRT